MLNVDRPLIVKWTDLLIDRACVLFLTLFTRHILVPPRYTDQADPVKVSLSSDPSQNIRARVNACARDGEKYLPELQILSESRLVLLQHALLSHHTFFTGKKLLCQHKCHLQ